MDDLIIPEKASNIFLKLHPVHRVLLGLFFTVLVYFLIRPYNMHPLLQLLYLWDVFAIVYLVTSWIIIYTRTVGQIRQFARREDGSLAYVFFLLILTSFSCLFALLLLFLSRDTISMSGYLYVFGSIPAMMLSWTMIHTTFTFHYANMYYDDAEGDIKRHAEGLDFPNEKKPDYRDFAYFSFVIGMTFQVSDVEITSRKIRRTALLHGLISFALNTLVVALTINLIAGLKK